MKYIFWIIICICLIILFSCEGSTDESIETKQQIEAVNYIITDDSIVEMIKEHHSYDVDLSELYADSNLAAKLYPDRYNDFFYFFRNEIDTLVEQNKIDSFNYKDFPFESSVDSSLVAYSTDKNGQLRVFFSQIEQNVMASEVYFRKNDPPSDFDAYRAISGLNGGISYLFVFSKSEIDTVIMKVVIND